MQSSHPYILACALPSTFLLDLLCYFHTCIPSPFTSLLLSLLMKTLSEARRILLLEFQLLQSLKSSGDLAE